MSSRLVCLFLLFMSKNILAQQEFVLKGVLIDKGNQLRVALAEVKNKRTLLSTGTDDMGFFRIKASVGDTLLVSKRNFNDLEVVVRNSVDLVLYLHRGATLNEVVITAQSRKQALEEIRQEFRNKGSYYDGKPPLKLLIPFGGSPVQFFYELFGKTPARARRFKRMYDVEIENAEVDHFFNKSAITKQTSLTGQALEEFLISHRPDAKTVKTWTNYDALKWINESYKKYKDTATLLK
jgi:hypothetical protein